MKTVGELKEFIKDLPDDLLLVTFKSDMETSGYRNDIDCMFANMEVETRHAFDSFDGTYFSYEVMVDSKGGKPCLKFY